MSKYHITVKHHKIPVRYISFCGEMVNGSNLSFSYEEKEAELFHTKRAAGCMIEVLKLYTNNPRLSFEVEKR